MSIINLIDKYMVIGLIPGISTLEIFLKEFDLERDSPSPLGTNE